MRVVVVHQFRGLGGIAKGLRDIAESNRYAARVSAGIVRPKEKSADAGVPDEWARVVAQNPEMPDIEREDLLDAFLKLSGRTAATDAERLHAANFYALRQEAYDLPDLDGRTVMNGLGGIGL